MKEFRFNVSHNGAFLFRTDWETDRVRANATEYALASRFRSSDGYRITKEWRSTETYSSDILNH